MDFSFTRLKITVSKDIINKSVDRLKAKGTVIEDCPISISLKGIFPKATVNEFVVKPFGSNRQFIALPVKASDFVIKFDDLRLRDIELCRLMPELTFEIDIPNWILKMAVNIDEILSILKNHKNLELI